LFSCRQNVYQHGPLLILLLTAEGTCFPGHVIGGGRSVLGGGSMAYMGAKSSSRHAWSKSPSVDEKSFGS
jgi:hypothetical protein